MESGDGVRSKEYGGKNGGSSVGMENGTCNESKAKQIRETVLLHKITSQMKSAVENDISRNDFSEHGTKCKTDDGVGLFVRNAGEQDKEGIK